jgi:hypothetical protein
MGSTAVFLAPHTQASTGGGCGPGTPQLVTSITTPGTQGGSATSLAAAAVAAINTWEGESTSGGQATGCEASVQVGGRGGYAVQCVDQ